MSTTNIRDELKIEDIYQQIIYVSDGFMLERYRNGKMDINQLEKEYDELIVFWKKAFGK